jgi:cellulose synthase/poly-beta-1,6-N-acetylglucosamine synthase-like glycosyltransferase
LKSGSVLAKAWWIIIHEGPAEILRRTYRYIRKRNWGSFYPYINQRRAYQLWLKREQVKTKEKLARAPGDIEAIGCRPLFSIIMPLVNIQIDHLEQTLNSILTQTYPFWELCAVATGETSNNTIDTYKYFQELDGRFKLNSVMFTNSEVQAINAALLMAKGDFVGFLDCGDELAPHALLEMSQI